MGPGAGGGVKELPTGVTCTSMVVSLFTAALGCWPGRLADTNTQLFGTSAGVRLGEGQPGRPIEIITGRARYSNFRQFKGTARLKAP